MRKQFLNMTDMIKKISVAVILALMAISLQAKPKAATSEQINRVEPPCWWTGMKTSLQIMVQGPQIRARVPSGSQGSP